MKEIWYHVVPPDSKIQKYGFAIEYIDNNWIVTKHPDRMMQGVLATELKAMIDAKGYFTFVVNKPTTKNNADSE